MLQRHASANIEAVKLKVVQPWYEQGLAFSCTGCGNCCTGGPGFIWISDQEIDRLAEFLKLSREEVLRRYCRRINGQISLKEKRPNARGEYDCVFLKEIPAEASPDGQSITYSKRICEIYLVRPLQCRTWPFWEGNLASPEAWAIAAKRCPGMNTGQKWSKQQILARRDATDWPEDS